MPNGIDGADDVEECEVVLRQLLADRSPSGRHRHRMSPLDPLLPVVSGSFRASWQATVRRPNPAENLERLRKTVELAFGRFDFVQVPFATNHYTRSSPGLARPIAKLLRADFEFYGVCLHLL